MRNPWFAVGRSKAMGPGFQFFQLSCGFVSTCFPSEHVAALSNNASFPRVLGFKGNCLRERTSLPLMGGHFSGFGYKNVSPVMGELFGSH